MTMSKPSQVKKLDHDTCMREIPRSEMGVAEADDYIFYFCGSDCYAEMSHETPPSEQPEDIT